MAKIKDEIIENMHKYDDSDYMPENGLSSDTKLAEIHHSGWSEQLHWNPVMKCLVELDNKCVQDGEDDVAFETENVRTYFKVSDLVVLNKKYA